MILLIHDGEVIAKTSALFLNHLPFKATSNMLDAKVFIKTTQEISCCIYNENFISELDLITYLPQLQNTAFIKLQFETDMTKAVPTHFVVNIPFTKETLQNTVNLALEQYKKNTTINFYNELDHILSNKKIDNTNKTKL